MSSLIPRVGSWYKERQLGHIFEVVAMDDSDATIETQLLDGEICEFDSDTWSELELEAVEAPEDWRSPYELSNEDYLSDEEFRPDQWGGPLDSIESDVINGLVDEDY